MQARKPLPPPKTRAIKFVGKTPRRRDNFFKTGLVWLPGEFHMVTEEQAETFNKYPDTWAECDPETGDVFMEKYMNICADKGIEPAIELSAGEIRQTLSVVSNETEEPDEAEQEDVDQESDEQEDPGKPEMDESELVDAVKEAILQLDRDDPKHFTTTGKPKVKAVESILARKITSDTIAEAWKDIDG